jgi:hypothetical protein
MAVTRRRHTGTHVWCPSQWKVVLRQASGTRIPGRSTPDRTYRVSTRFYRGRRGPELSGPGHVGQWASEKSSESQIIVMILQCTSSIAQEIMQQSPLLKSLQGA